MRTIPKIMQEISHISISQIFLSLKFGSGMEGVALSMQLLFLEHASNMEFFLIN